MITIQIDTYQYDLIAEALDKAIAVAERDDQQQLSDEYKKLRMEIIIDTHDEVDNL